MRAPCCCLHGARSAGLPQVPERRIQLLLARSMTRHHVTLCQHSTARAPGLSSPPPSPCSPVISFLVDRLRVPSGLLTGFNGIPKSLASRMQWEECSGGAWRRAWKRSGLCQALNTTELKCDNLIWLPRACNLTAPRTQSSPRNFPKPIVARPHLYSSSRAKR
jgi:hypothetical protein